MYKNSPFCNSAPPPNIFMWEKMNFLPHENVEIQSIIWDGETWKKSLTFSSSLTAQPPHFRSSFIFLIIQFRWNHEGRFLTETVFLLFLMVCWFFYPFITQPNLIKRTVLIWLEDNFLLCFWREYLFIITVFFDTSDILLMNLSYGNFRIPPWTAKSSMKVIRNFIILEVGFKVDSLKSCVLTVGALNLSIIQFVL